MKQLRQRAIRDLVEQRPIRTQQELAAALRERGFRTTQATISRDVAELGLVKAGRNGTQAYAIPPRLREADSSGEERIRRLLHDMPVDIREAGTMLVLHTLPGSAHPLAAALDRALPADMREGMIRNTPLQRLGETADIAAAALYLATPASGWVTGKILEVDGGAESSVWPG